MFGKRKPETVQTVQPEMRGNIRDKIRPLMRGNKWEVTGWVCPSYDASRPVRLDPHIVAENRCIAALPGSPDLEAYKVLRTKILKLTREKGWNTIMVTSAMPGEGKTLTAINLSMTFAREFSQTVLLVDCDLRKQNIHKVLGIRSHKGLIDYLLNDVPMNEVMMWPGIAWHSASPGRIHRRESGTCGASCAVRCG